MNTPDVSSLRDDPFLHRVWEQMGRPRGCRVTGGYVRDRLLGRPSNDLDLTIDGDDDHAAGPARRLGKALGVRSHLLGTAPHRIWRVETDQLKIEIWPLGALTHEDDMARRDFSCNALSWEMPNGPLVDLVGGLADIENRRLRAISRSNLEDDPVRLLRGPRFLAQLEDFELERTTGDWIRELAANLVTAPRERVGTELLTLLRAPAAARGLRKCLNLGLFEPAAPKSSTVDMMWLRTNLGALDTMNVRHRSGGSPPLKKAERQCGAGVSPARGRSGSVSEAARLALLFRAWGTPDTSSLSPYGWPRPDRENALTAARLLDDGYAAVDASPADRREFAWSAGAAFPALIALAAALDPDRSGWRRWLRQWRRNPEALLDPRPLLSGIEIATITGVDPGPKLGEIAQSLLRAQVRREVRTRGGAMRWLQARSC